MLLQTEQNSWGGARAPGVLPAGGKFEPEEDFGGDFFFLPINRKEETGETSQRTESNSDWRDFALLGSALCSARLGALLLLGALDQALLTAHCSALFCSALLTVHCSLLRHCSALLTATAHSLPDAKLDTNPALLSFLCSKRLVRCFLVDEAKKKLILLGPRG